MHEQDFSIINFLTSSIFKAIFLILMIITPAFLIAFVKVQNFFIVNSLPSKVMFLVFTVMMPVLFVFTATEHLKAFKEKWQGKKETKYFSEVKRIKSNLIVLVPIFIVMYEVGILFILSAMYGTSPLTFLLYKLNLLSFFHNHFGYMP